MTMTLNVVAKLVDGGQQEFHAGPDFLSKLHALESKGVEGKALIHALLTDDWGAPPLLISVSGTAADGSAINITIPYR